MHECVAQAVETGLRIDAGDLDRRELEQGLRRDLEQLVRDEAASESPLVPRHLEVSFRAFELEPGVVVSGKIDRVDGDRMGARGIVARLQVGRGLVGRRDPRARPSAAAALHARAPRSARDGADGRRLRPGRRRAPRARHAARAGTTRCRGSAGATISSRTSSTPTVERRARRRSHSSSGSGPATSCTTRTAASAPHWCDLWRMCRKERP